jgi:hypothetical protein
MDDMLIGAVAGLLLALCIFVLLPNSWIIAYAEWLKFQDTIDNDNIR